MSSRRIGSTPFLELLPDSIAGDPAIRAAADALDGLLVPSVKAIPSLLLYARLYGKEPDLLPPLRRLAEQAGAYGRLRSRCWICWRGSSTSTTTTSPGPTRSGWRW